MRYAALLRGVNVGGANRVTMPDLRRVVASLGWDDPHTLLTSGNVVFTGPARDLRQVAGEIQLALADQLGLSAAAVVLSAADVRTAVAGNPFAENAQDEASRLLVGFLAPHAETAGLAELAARDWSPEALHVADRFVYVWCPTGVAHSPVMAALTKAAGTGLTTRNWATVVKLKALLDSLAVDGDRPAGGSPN